MQTYRVLFIDDEETVLRALSTYFEKLGHEVYTATSGKDGIGLFEQVHPHVAIVDLVMPGMSGMDVLDYLVRQHATVIMLTGRGEVEAAVQAMRHGAENFLQKPVDMPHLVATVEKAAEKARLRREVTELRARLSPTAKRALVRLGLVLVLIAAGVGVGALIGSSGRERPMNPIPVPIVGDSTP